MSLLDPISEKDADALGRAFGDALGKRIAPAIRDAVADSIEKYESVTFTVTVKLNKG